MAEYPYEPTLSGPYPTPTQLEAAKPFRINGYGALWDHGVTNAPYPGNDVELAKGWLADGYVLASEIETENGDWPDSHQNPSAVFYDPPGKTNGSRLRYSLPQSKTRRVFGGAGRRGSGLEGENPCVAAADGGLGTARSPRWPTAKSGLWHGPELN
jgi:hypothetical protein